MYTANNKKNMCIYIQYNKQLTKDIQSIHIIVYLHIYFQSFIMLKGKR